MNYELAKQLKDAGFPQWDNESPRYIGYKDAETVSFPTLSELIESCGKYISLHQEPVYDKWEAESIGHSEIGSTPEEAMAKLFLKLHK